jgi:Dynamin family
MEQTDVKATTVAEDHLDFADQLLSMFDPADSRRQSWQNRIGHARGRLADPHYYLAIIGEFNAGKSTAINALLEAELFAASILPTTAAAVRVKHGQRFVIRAGFNDGSTWTSNAETVTSSARWRKLGKVEATEEFGARLTIKQVRARLASIDGRDALRVLTADRTVAPRVTSVEVEYPSPLLASGLVLIDTPGASSGDTQHGAEHVEIARRAVADADAAVVINKQDQLLPESLATFLTEALDEGLLARCAFVVTRADQVEPGKFAEQDQNVRERITAMLKLADPPVVWAAPSQVVRRLRGELLDQDALVWVARFDETRQWLRRIVSERRPTAVADTALRLIQELLDGLTEGLADDLKRLERQQRELAKAAPTDMAGFLSAQLKSGIRELDAAEHEVRRSVATMTRRTRGDIANAIEEKIAECGNGKQIRLALDDDIPPLVNAELRGLARRAEAAAQRDLDARLTAVGSELRSAFAAEYAKLERIDAAPASGGRGRPRVAAVSTGGTTFADATGIATRDSQRDAVALGSGAGVGAVIGTMVFPVFGTVVGAALGWLVGALFTESIATVRERAVDAATASADELVEEAGDLLADAVGELADQARAELRGQAGWYRSAYSKTIRAMHDAHRTGQQALQTRHDLLTRARSEATQRNAAIATERARLLSVDRVETTDPYGGGAER